MNYETAKEIERALSYWINTSNHLIVPNFSWGMGLHECDLLAISKSGYATEFEIKISVSDLRRDIKKRHSHNSNRIKFLYFAMPVKMRGHELDVPERAGIIYILKSGSCVVERRPHENKNATKVSEQEQLKLAKLGVLRMWNLKTLLLQQQNIAQSDFQI